MSDSITTTMYRDSMIQMFLDATENEVYDKGRLATRRNGENRVELIAYGWNKIAEYDEVTDTVTVFAGHSDNISDTVDRYVELVHEVAGKRQSRTVNVLADAAPNVGRPPADSAQFIDNYQDFYTENSSVEDWAKETVEKAVTEAVKQLI